MTTEKYCKNLAEVNNTLRFQTTIRQRAVTQADKTRSVDCCATDPLESGGGGGRPTDRSATGGGAHKPRAPLNSSQQANVDEAGDHHGQDADDSGDYVYPNGWLPVMESSKVRPGEIVRAIIMGRDAIIMRSFEGRVSVLDAYCPHMGVHIGVGGKIVRVDDESCVQCPFHGWTFRATDGMCVRVPYAETGSKCSGGIPRQARLGTWICDEVNNFIFVWHHIDSQPPAWRIEQLPELNDDGWLLIGRSCHTTNLDLRDMLENGADMNHFEGIHNDLFVFGSEYLKVQNFSWFQKYARHHWAPNWEPIISDDGKTTHTAELTLCSWISLFKLRLFDISLRAKQIGPAHVILKFQSKWYGQGILNMYSIPLGGRRTLYIQHIYTKNNYFDRFMAKWVLYGEIKQVSSSQLQ
jgi:cholesterol 7-dehydrogenase